MLTPNKKSKSLKKHKRKKFINAVLLAPYVRHSKFKKDLAAELGLKRSLGRQLGVGQLGLLWYLLLPGCQRKIWEGCKHQKKKERKTKEKVHDFSPK